MTNSTIILVHGLWMAGPQLSLLKARLHSRTRWPIASFSYPSVQGVLEDHSRSLLTFARQQHAPGLHFVGHSLGGLLILRALEMNGDLPPGRAVLLGSPLQGSKAAQGVARALPFGRTIMGRAICEECIESRPRTWSGAREVGVIAGSARFGLGRLFAELGDAHDGTVSVAETQLPGAKDHIILRTTHTGMLLSAAVAEQTAWFLRYGEFRRERG